MIDHQGPSRQRAFCRVNLLRHATARGEFTPVIFTRSTAHLLLTDLGDADNPFNQVSLYDRFHFAPVTTVADF
jgi:hypothetical protein